MLMLKGKENWKQEKKEGGEEGEGEGRRELSDTIGREYGLVVFIFSSTFSALLS